MTPMKVDLLVALFAYAGNGGVRTILPEIGLWLARLLSKCENDERIGRVATKIYGDIPLTMERNRVVRDAKEQGYDLILMIDSDNSPDLYLGKKPWAEPFWESSFDFTYERLLRGIPSSVCAPYCGPPPHPTNGGEENVYVFKVHDFESHAGSPGFKFEAYDRVTASQMRGIQPIAAGPTGCIMYTTSAFDLMPIGEWSDEQIMQSFARGEISMETALRRLRMQSYFWYEFTDRWQSRKASTEDVTNLREIQMAGVVKHHEPVVFCNWSAWAGHWKPKCVGMPEPIRIEQVSEIFQEAVRQNVGAFDEIRQVDFRVPDIAPEESEPEEEVEPSTPDAEPTEINGLEVVPRCIAGRKVLSVGHQTHENDLQALHDIVHQEALRSPQRPLRLLEVGSWVGESALAMHAGLGAQGGHIYCVDTWEGTASDKTGAMATQLGGPDALFELFAKNVGELLNESIRVLRGSSEHFAETLDPQEFDLVFIDADHSYAGCLADIEAWFQHVADTGVICGHDYCSQFPGVIDAVAEFCDRAGITPTVLSGTSVWKISKTQWLKGHRKLKAEREQPKLPLSEPATSDA